ncbi:MAG TPA: CHAT domain-containing protein, partial [Thermoguttaceae bacterium]|nr:CHAT domain-containing protein [Thermoguttaceae bacterium]
MSLLRITQSAAGEGRYRAELRLEGDGAPLTAAVEFPFEMTDQDQEDLRWYLEDYLQYPHEPAPTVAARIEERLAELGTGLFRSVFQANDDARDLWAVLRGKLDETRVEVITSVEEATSIPWELIRDPRTDTALALRATAFVRAQPQAAQRPELPETESGPIRILLVICRPGGRDDVPFRSVAGRLLKGLGEEARAAFQLDVLRPATFERLAQVLRQAKDDGRPYHVVHFDGHGMHADLSKKSPSDWLRRLGNLVLSGPRTGPHGYLLFENPTDEENAQPVDGPTLGKLLVETHVPVLVLNACRSAHAEAPTEPRTAAAADDPHAQIRAYGSLAQEVMDAGVAGVVAMRYNVYVVTAAQFVADLYATLVRGRTLGESVTLGRKQLAAKPQREIAAEPRPLQDWCVPVVYEAAPIRLFPPRDEAARLEITLDAGESAAGRGSLDTALPKPPDVGFFGRDETLLAIDRALDAHPIVLLHAFAGSGKTATAAEFARWYALTGGVDGPVLFTSFEQYTPLVRVLDRIGEVFGPALEQSGVHWLALDDKDRGQVALQVLRQIPVLWIWDNVEPVAGFPTGSESAYSGPEQQELADFLRDAAQTRAKFLLTSRRDERGWLGDTLPRRIEVPPMPMQERIQLARAIAERHGRRLADVDDWRPLLRFTGGNPLTLTVLVGQALRDGLRTREQIEEFVDALRAGEARFDDEASEGRTRSLGASLSYGFEHAFSEAERKQLALLHLFQGFVDVDALKAMGHPEAPWCLPAVRGLTREVGIALLDRAAEVGLLTAHGGGYYTIHPALPWFFKGLFDHHFPSTLPGEGLGGAAATNTNRLGEAPAIPTAGPPNPALTATHAFVEAMGELGNYYHHEYGAGNRDVISALTAEEANLLHARRLARSHGWWYGVASAMQGLHQLYDHTGRRAEWARLMEEITPDFVDPATDGPLPGREEDWSVVTQYRVRLEERRQWAEAERLQRRLVDWTREQADEAVRQAADRLAGADKMAAVPAEASETLALRDCLRQVVEDLTDDERNSILTLGASLHEMGEIQRERQEPACVDAYGESLDVSETIGERSVAATCAFNLGHAYKDLPEIRDLDEAERWYRRSLELRPEGDRLGRARSSGQLGGVALDRFKEAHLAGRGEEELLKHLNAALQSYHQVLELLPQNAVNDLAVTHSGLGGVYGCAGDMDLALRHFRESIRYEELQGNVYGAARTRFNVAAALAQSGPAGRRPRVCPGGPAGLRTLRRRRSRQDPEDAGTAGGDRREACFLLTASAPFWSAATCRRFLSRRKTQRDGFH